MFLTKILFFLLIKFSTEIEAAASLFPSTIPETLPTLKITSFTLPQCYFSLEKISININDYEEQWNYALNEANTISSEIGEVLYINGSNEESGHIEDHHNEWTISGDVEIEKEPEILKDNGINILKKHLQEMNKTELLNLEGIEKYLERQLRQSRHKHCLLLMVKELAIQQKDPVHFRVEALALNKEIKELFDKATTREIDVAKAEIRLANLEQDESSSMSLFGIITGADKQNVFYGISTAELHGRKKRKGGLPTIGFDIFSGVLKLIHNIG